MISPEKVFLFGNTFQQTNAPHPIIWRIPRSKRGRILIKPLPA